MLPYFTPVDFISKEDIEFLENLEDDDDVQNVYSNINLKDN